MRQGLLLIMMLMAGCSQRGVQAFSDSMKVIGRNAGEYADRAEQDRRYKENMEMQQRMLREQQLQRLQRQDQMCTTMRNGDYYYTNCH